VKKPQRFLRRLFQAAVEIDKENIAEGFLYRFPRLRQLPQAFRFRTFLSFCFFFFLCGNPRLASRNMSRQDRL
jgi:hypothetical protein